MATLPRGPRLCFGGDYNPEQWPEEVWAEDVRADARGRRQPGDGRRLLLGACSSRAPGAYEFGWLDRVLDLLAGGGIAVDLATATASPPPWFSHRTTRVAAGRPRRPPALAAAAGRRSAPARPSTASAALALVAAAGRALRRPSGARAVARPQRVRLPQRRAATATRRRRAFRDLAAAAGTATLDALNEAWGTGFWSQRYTDWDAGAAAARHAHVRQPDPAAGLPRGSPRTRCWSCFVAERDVLHRALTRHAGHHQLHAGMLHRRWTTGAGRRELDVVSNDHYLTAARPGRARRAWPSRADLTRSLAGGGRGC